MGIDVLSSIDVLELMGQMPIKNDQKIPRHMILGVVTIVTVPHWKLRRVLSFWITI